MSFKKILVYARRLWNFYKHDETPSEAAALSFYTIFALIPTLIIALSLLIRVDLLQPFLQRINSFLIANLMPANEKIFATYIDEFLQKSANIEFMGVFFVLFSSIMFFISYEDMINRIYQTKNRNYFLSTVAYFTLTIGMPIGFILAFYVSDEILLLFSSFGLDLSLSWVMPYVFLWFIFFTAYKISPNKKVDMFAATVSSLLFVSVWIVAKNIFVFYMFYNKNYVTLYGQLSIILFFMLWIYVSWIIFIYGLKFCKFLDSKNQI